MKGVNIFLADGFDDVEALATCDVLRRGGVDVKLAGVSGKEVRSSHGVRILADIVLSDMDFSSGGTGSRDVMIFPGGMPGTKNLAACGPLMRAMQDHYDAGGTVAAICAAPGYVLGQLRDLDGVRFTCFDGCEELPLSKGAVFEPRDAVVCGRIITGRSAGHAQAFGLRILESVAGAEAAAKVEYAMNLETEE
ncbi:MAG: DJ-1/PfpI family protein [Bacteroidales bacterium]|nr:DJ-1/PfpI family protein [Bacteroidales bacterium]